MDHDITTQEENSRYSSQWHSQASFAQVSVPKFNSCANVYDFLTEYEDATVGMTDAQRALLLNRAFPPGCHRTWYDNKLKPLIKASSPWKIIKDKILERFSMQDNRDRHLAKLRELKFNPEENRMLLDFVDDMIYSYERAYPADTDKESCIRWIKTALPQNVQAALSVNPDYQCNTDMDKLMRAVKQYDMSQSVNGGKQSDRQLTAEMASMVKDLVSTVRKELESCKKDNEATRKSNQAVVAAFQTGQSSRSYGDNWRDRQRSPQRVRYEGRRSPSPVAARRSPSPMKQGGTPNTNWRQEQKPGVPKEYAVARPEPGPVNKLDKAFSAKSYFDKFGVPPTPCSECNEDLWHWARHCHKRLN